MFPYALLKTKFQGQKVTPSQSQYITAVAHIPVQHKSSNHGNIVHQKGIMESLSGNGNINGSSSSANAHTPFSSSHMSSSSLQLGIGTQGFETQASI